MVLSRLTKITGPGIRTDTNWVGNNANYTGILTASSLGGIGNITATGIITASSFSGDGSGLIGVASTDNIITGTAATFNTYPVDINAGMTVAGVATFAGNVSIAGTLTYEDVTNIDSVGIITGKGADINGDLDVDGHTNLDNVSIAGVTTFASNIFLGDGDKIYLGADNDMYLWHTGSDGLLYNDTGNLFIRGGGGGSLTLQSNSIKIRNDANTEDLAKFTANGAVELYYDNSKKVQTANYGLTILDDILFDNPDNSGKDLNWQNNFNRLVFFDGVSATFGIGADLNITHTGTNTNIQNNTGNLNITNYNTNSDDILIAAKDDITIQVQTNENSIKCIGDGAVELYHDNIKRLETSSVGVSIPQDLDVDGHTNLDNVNIAGIVTATRFVGNGDRMSGIHTVATNPAVTPSNSLLAIGNAGSYRFIQSHGGQELRINSAGNNVILPATRSYVGSNPVANITNNADNRVITGGSNGVINGESTFTYDGNYLTLNNNADQEGILMTGGDVYHTLTFNANRNIQNYSLGDVRGKWNGTEVNRIRFNTGADTTNRDEGWITFWTKPSGGGIVERLRIGSDGQINVAGILTATTVQQRTLRFYGVTTTDRNALSSSEGDMIYNTTTNKHEVYNSSGNWVPFVIDPPVFDNNSGSLGTIYHMSRSAYSLTNPTATDTTGSITYSITSGSLPGGLSLNTSTAAITGTANSVGSDSTSTFTIKAENSGGSVSRSYSITVKAQVTSNYSYQGTTVTWTKPSGVRYVGFYMWGGGGSQGTCTSNGNRAGAGGNTTGIIDAQNHSALYLQVAQSGQNPSGSSAGGWPNGGEGNDEHSCKGGGGGGSSNIYNSSGTGSFGNLIAVAGGGGGVSHGNPNSNGGDGGGTNGSSSNRGGGGGSQNAGGSLGSTPCGNAGNAGSALQGGNAGTGTGCTNAGGGGGGGYYGGGAGGNSNGGNSYGGGGGGSGYFDTSLVSSGATRSYGESGWGSNKPSGIADRPSSSDQVEGGNGHITLYY